MFPRKYYRARSQIKKLTIFFILSLTVIMLLYSRKNTSNYQQEIKEISVEINENGTQSGKVIAVLVLVCNRVTVTRTLDQLLKYRPDSEIFPIILSQDCGENGMAVNLLARRKYGDKLTYIVNPYYQDTDSELIDIPDHMKGYYHIASHYGWALNYTFNNLGFENVIIVEDDLDVSPDFFEYFKATLPLLFQDSSIWCVSAYNDNGKPHLIDLKTSGLLYRTDFFPGLGWMLVRDLWNELNGKWPKAFWDDWMRLPDQRKDRACIHPEMSRTKTYGRIGASNGQFFDLHLNSIKLNKEFIAFGSRNLTYLKKASYDSEFFNRVNASILVPSLKVLEQKISSSRNALEEYRLIYRNEIQFKRIAKYVGLMADFKGGVPRSGYQGIVPLMYRHRRLYIVPQQRNSNTVDEM